MDSIDDDAVGRVESEIDLYDGDFYNIRDVKSKIGDRFHDFSPQQKQGFAQKIINKQENKGIVSDRNALDAVTSLSGRGFAGKRNIMVRDSSTGRYLGSRQNIVVTGRTGARIYVRNTKTGKTGRIR